MLTQVEGFLSNAAENLELLQPQRFVWRVLKILVSKTLTPILVLCCLNHYLSNLRRRCKTVKINVDDVIFMLLLSQFWQVEIFETAQKIQVVIEKLKAMCEADVKVLPFSFIIDDPSGNSFIQNMYVTRNSIYEHG